MEGSRVELFYFKKIVGDDLKLKLKLEKNIKNLFH